MNKSELEKEKIKLNKTLEIIQEILLKEKTDLGNLLMILSGIERSYGVLLIEKKYILVI